jgi:integrase
MKDPPRGPVFIALKTTGKGKATDRLSPRMAQISFHSAQRRAGIGRRDQYRFHDLRHSYATAIAAASGGDVYTVAAAARLDSLNNTLRYVHDNYTRTAAIIEAAGKDL